MVGDSGHQGDITDVRLTWSGWIGRRYLRVVIPRCSCRGLPCLANTSPRRRLPGAVKAASGKAGLFAFVDRLATMTFPLAVRRPKNVVL